MPIWANFQVELVGSYHFLDCLLWVLCWALFLSDVSSIAEEGEDEGHDCSMDDVHVKSMEMEPCTSTNELR